MVGAHQQTDGIQEASRSDTRGTRTDRGCHSESRYAGTDRTGKDWVCVIHWVILGPVHPESLGKRHRKQLSSVNSYETIHI